MDRTQRVAVPKPDTPAPRVEFDNFGNRIRRRNSASRRHRHHHRLVTVTPTTNGNHNGRIQADDIPSATFEVKPKSETIASSSATAAAAASISKKTFKRVRDENTFYKKRGAWNWLLARDGSPATIDTSIKRKNATINDANPSAASLTTTNASTKRKNATSNYAKNSAASLTTTNAFTKRKNATSNVAAPSATSLDTNDTSTKRKSDTANDAPPSAAALDTTDSMERGTKRRQLPQYHHEVLESDCGGGGKRKRTEESLMNNDEQDLFVPTTNLNAVRNASTWMKDVEEYKEEMQSLLLESTNDCDAYRSRSDAYLLRIQELEKNKGKLTAAITEAKKEHDELFQEHADTKAALEASKKEVKRLIDMQQEFKSKYVSCREEVDSAKVELQQKEEVSPGTTTIRPTILPTILPTIRSTIRPTIKTIRPTTSKTSQPTNGKMSLVKVLMCRRHIKKIMCLRYNKSTPGRAPIRERALSTTIQPTSKTIGPIRPLPLPIVLPIELLSSTTQPTLVPAPYLPRRFELFGMNYNNSRDLPSGIADPSAVTKEGYRFLRDFDYQARTTHHLDPSFPIVPPDSWMKPSAYTRKSHEITADDYLHITDEARCRTLYVNAMKKNMKSPGNVWKSNCKHYVRGACYNNVSNRFFVMPLKQPEKINGKWKNYIYRIQVAVRDENKNQRTTAFIECSHVPILFTNTKHECGLGKQLHVNATKFNFQKNGCRQGQNLGAMACIGTGVYANQLVQDKNTDNILKDLEDAARYVFDHYGFIHWVGNLSTRFLDISANINTILEGGSGSKFPWMSLCVTTNNYGNEYHQDLGNACQGITIWHEENPPHPQKGKPIGCRVKNWYFLFPDMEIMVDGEWRKGVAIPLQHGTIVSWDARLLRHCTAIPTIDKCKRGSKNEGKPMTAAYGTYFGIDKRFENKLVKMKAERLAAEAAAKAKAKAE